MFEAEFFGNGFSVTTIHRDRPPKLRLGPGYRFFTNSQFGDLALFGKSLVEGCTIGEAMEISGVKRQRAKRFLKFLLTLKPEIRATALYRPPREKKPKPPRIKKPRIKKEKPPRVPVRYSKTCAVCSKEFQAKDNRHCTCGAQCRKIHRKTFCREYYRVYTPQYRRKRKEKQMQIISGTLNPDNITVEISSSGKLQVKDQGINAAKVSGIVGNPVAKTIGTIYQAATDGEVRAQVSATADAQAGYLEGFSDATATPTTSKGKDSVAQNAQTDHCIIHGSISFLVKKGDYYQLTLTAESVHGAATIPGTASMSFTPIGS